MSPVDLQNDSFGWPGKCNNCANVEKDPPAYFTGKTEEKRPLIIDQASRQKKQSFLRKPDDREARYPELAQLKLFAIEETSYFT